MLKPIADLEADQLDLFAPPPAPPAPGAGERWPKVRREFGTGHRSCSWCGERETWDDHRAIAWLAPKGTDCPNCPLTTPHGRERAGLPPQAPGEPLDPRALDRDDRPAPDGTPPCSCVPNEDGHDHEQECPHRFDLPNLYAPDFNCPGCTPERNGRKAGQRSAYLLECHWISWPDHKPKVVRSPDEPDPADLTSDDLREVEETVRVSWSAPGARHSCLIIDASTLEEGERVLCLQHAQAEAAFFDLTVGEASDDACSNCEADAAEVEEQLRDDERRQRASVGQLTGKDDRAYTVTCPSPGCGADPGWPCKGGDKPHLVRSGLAWEAVPPDAEAEKATRPYPQPEHEAARQVECPLCHSPPGERCLNTSGIMRTAHGQRRSAARAARRAARAEPPPEPEPPAPKPRRPRKPGAKRAPRPAPAPVEGHGPTGEVEYLAQGEWTIHSGAAYNPGGGVFGKVTKCRARGVVFYVREGLGHGSGIGDFTTPGSARLALKRGEVPKDAQRTLHLCAPADRWDELAQLVHREDALARVVVKHRQFTEAWAEDALERGAS